MKDRIKKIRNSIPEYGKTQETFAKYLGISKQNLASYETGRRIPSDAVVQLICEKCNINVEWLRTGKGEMCKPIQDKLSFYLGQIKSGDDEFIKDIIEVYMELDPTSKEALKKLMNGMIERQRNREQN